MGCIYSFKQRWGVPAVINSPGLVFSPLLQPTWSFPTITSSWSDNMNFYQRLYQAAVLQPVELALKLTLLIYSKWINGRRSPPLYTSLFHGSTVGLPLLVNTAVGFEYSRYRTAITHYTGPLIEEIPDSKLPSDIETWLRDKSAVLFVSMGSTAHVNADIISAIEGAIKATNYSAIWTTGVTDRRLFNSVDSAMIKTVKWLPQRTLLSHPSVHIALLHCGINGLQEAIVNEVPVICLPQMFDQPANAIRVKYHNIGFSLDPLKLTAKNLANSINLITMDFNYQESVSRMADILKSGGGVQYAAELVEYYQDIGLAS